MTTYALIDDATHNILGEFASRDEAEELRAKLIAADSSVERDLRISEAESSGPPPAPAITVRHS